MNELTIEQVVQAVENNGVWYFDSEVEFNEAVVELEENPDFSIFTISGTIESVLEELEYQGLSLEAIKHFTTNHYGSIIDILQNPTNKMFHVYVGQK